jgi:hypothetical protein
MDSAPAISREDARTLGCLVGRAPRLPTPARERDLLKLRRDLDPSRLRCLRSTATWSLNPWSAPNPSIALPVALPGPVRLGLQLVNLLAPPSLWGSARRHRALACPSRTLSDSRVPSRFEPARRVANGLAERAGRGRVWRNFCTALKLPPRLACYASPAVVQQSCLIPQAAKGWQSCVCW